MSILHMHFLQCVRSVVRVPILNIVLVDQIVKPVWWRWSLSGEISINLWNSIVVFSLRIFIFWITTWGFVKITYRRLFGWRFIFPWYYSVHQAIIWSLDHFSMLQAINGRIVLSWYFPVLRAIIVEFLRRERQLQLVVFLRRERKIQTRPSV